MTSRSDWPRARATPPTGPLLMYLGPNFLPGTGGGVGTSRFISLVTGPTSGSPTAATTTL